MGKRRRLGESLRRIRVIAENESAVDHDAARVQALDDIFIAAGNAVPVLPHLLEAGLVERFKTDQRQRTAGVAHQVEQRVIARHVNGDLARPPHFERDESLHQFNEALAFPQEVVIDKKHHLVSWQRAEFGDDVGAGALLAMSAVESMNGAEIAGEAAAAPDLHQRQRRVAFARIDAAVEVKTLPCALGLLALIALLQSAGASVGDDTLPQAFGIADHHAVGVRLRLIGDHGRMVAANHYWHAPGAVDGGNLVGAPGGEGFDRDGDKVRRHGGKGFDPFVNQRGRNVRRRAGAQNGEDQRRHRIGGIAEAKIGAHEGNVFHATAAPVPDAPCRRAAPRLASPPPANARDTDSCGIRARAGRAAAPAATAARRQSR